MDTAALEMHEPCDDCSLNMRLVELGHEVLVIKEDLHDVSKELRGDIGRMNETMSVHMTNLANLILRFNSKLDHADQSMQELLTGLSELGITVKTNMTRRARKARSSKRSKPNARFRS